MTDALVIGAGPAGLMAADQLAKAGYSVVITDAKPSAGRKFLMAGKSGLNLTKDEPFETLIKAYAESSEPLYDIIKAFDAEAIQEWAKMLDQPVFTGSSGRVFPKVMKASPLLRTWLQQLKGHHVDLRTRWRWLGFDGDNVLFDTPDGQQTIKPKVVVLAMGGASWSRLGSDGKWADALAGNGVTIVDFKPVNMGFRVDWSGHMEKHFGHPVKSVVLKAGDLQVPGEFVVSAKGIEGGGVYAVSKPVRDGADLFVDLLPDISLERIRERLSDRGKSSLTNHLRKKLKLPPIKQALLMEFARPLPDDLAPVLKNLPIIHAGPRPMDEAISTSGGISWNALDENLMLKDYPGVFCAGEMIDWDAPTGGYLITACLATGRWAGQSAVKWLQSLPDHKTCTETALQHPE